MISQLLQSEYLKVKRKGFLFLTFLGPFGVVALQMVNYGVRKEYLLKQSENDWEFYILNVHSFLPLALILGIVILSSFMASIENENHSWDQLLSLPISKMNMYFSKFILLASFLLLSSFLLFIFMIAYGIYLDFNDKIPYLMLVKYSLYPYLTVLPVLTLQLWLAIAFRNQSVSMSVGVIGVLLAYSWPLLPDWVIWKWPSLINTWEQPIVNVLLGLLIGSLFLICGMLHFSKKDVK